MSKRDTPRTKSAATQKGPQADDGLTQSERFIKAAQELGTDDDPERFRERVQRLAKAPVKRAAQTEG